MLTIKPACNIIVITLLLRIYIFGWKIPTKGYAQTCTLGFSKGYCIILNGINMW